MISKKTPL